MDRRVASQLLFCLVLGPGTSRVALAQTRLEVRQQAIVGGRATDNGAASATALIGECDATLVAQDLLLTAAHCVVDTVPTQVWFGPSVERAQQILPIARCEAHPDYPSKQGTDIAYCRLASDVIDIVPARLGSTCDDELPTEGQHLVLRGHGYTTAARQEARIEREVDVQIDALQAEGRELVVGDYQHGGCNGDSGGSAYAAPAGDELALIGVISRRGPSLDGEPAEDCASTTVVTRVAPHLAWLAQRTGDFSSADCGATRQDSSEDGWLSDLPEDEPFAFSNPPANGTRARVDAQDDASRDRAPSVAGCALGYARGVAPPTPSWCWALLLPLALRSARRRASRAVR